MALALHAAFLGFVRRWEVFAYRLLGETWPSVVVSIFIAFNHVSFVENLAAAWKYVIVFLVDGSSKTWEITSSGGGRWISTVSVLTFFTFCFVTFSWKGTRHSPSLVLYLLRTAASETTILHVVPL